MKYCAKCGKELLDETVVCPGCGCPTQAPQEKQNEKKRISKKQIIVIASIAVALIVAIIAGTFLWNHIRTEQVKEQLAGNRYECTEIGLYSGYYGYYEFDGEEYCSHYYYFASLDYDNEYRTQYEIEFDGDEVYLIIGEKEFEVRYDRHGEIEGLYDVTEKRLYE